MTKLLIICHDALDKTLVQKFNLRFALNGKFANYKSMYQETVPSWVSIYTGLPREKHGLNFGWMYWLKSKCLKELPCVWNEINCLGYSVGLMGLPLTYPPQRIQDGWMVSGFPTVLNTTKITYPLALSNLLEKYKIDILQTIEESFGKKESPVYLERYHYEKFRELQGLKMVKSLIDCRLEHLEKILNQYSTNILFLGFSFVDHAGHLGGDLDAIYNLANYSIEEAQKLIHPRQTLVISDHGARPIEGKRFFHTADAVLFGERVPQELVHEWDIKDVILNQIS